MVSSDSILIVEDESDWRAIYQRAATKQGFTTIEQAATLAGASELLRSRKFAVAFVDVGLDVEDDSNIDGLRVMELIRSLQDETSIIVVTGRSGSDVVEITRDALVKHRAFEAVSKATVTPAALEDLLARGLVAFREAEAKQRPPVHDVLRGSIESTIWDDQILRSMRIARGVAGLYAFLDGLVGRFLPLVAPPGFPGMRVDASSGVAHGAYWSRSVGHAIAVVFGPRAAVDAVLAGRRVDRYDLGEALHTAAGGDIAGAVCALPDPRESFAD